MLLKVERIGCVEEIHVREWLSSVAVLVILVAGIIAFFVMLPPELTTITNFVSYMSSLSTIIMVLVFFFTTSRQLSIMRNQLDEMQFSRNVEVQPLPNLEIGTASVELPRYYVGPGTDFRKMRIMCRFFFTFNVTNIGNGPAVAVDFIPKLYGRLPPEKETMTLVETVGRRVECISLREGDSKKTHFMFLDGDHKAVEALAKGGEVALPCTIIFKNALGMAFKEEIKFWVDIPSEKEAETIRTCLKTVRTAEIDFREQVEQFVHQMEHGREKRAREIFRAVNRKLGEKFAGQEELELFVQIASGSFAVSPISQSEYEKILAQKKEIKRRLDERY